MPLFPPFSDSGDHFREILNLATQLESELTDGRDSTRQHELNDEILAVARRGIVQFDTEQNEPKG